MCFEQSKRRRKMGVSRLLAPSSLLARLLKPDDQLQLFRGLWAYVLRFEGHTTDYVLFKIKNLNICLQALIALIRKQKKLVGGAC